MGIPGLEGHKGHKGERGQPGVTGPKGEVVISKLHIFHLTSKEENSGIILALIVLSHFRG